MAKLKSYTCSKCAGILTFDSAKEKFGLVLDNDPHNFDALLVSVLCVLRLSSADELEDSSNLQGRDLTNAKKALSNAKRFSVGDKSVYFGKFIMIIVGVCNKDEEHDANYNPAKVYEEKLDYKIEEQEKNYKRALQKMKKLLASPAAEEKEPHIVVADPSAAFPGANYDDEYKQERQELVSKTYPAQVKLKKLEEEFSGVLNELTSARNGCRLI